MVISKFECHKANNVYSWMIEYELAYPIGGYGTRFKLGMKRIMSHRGELEVKYIVTATRLASCD